MILISERQARVLRRASADDLKARIAAFVAATCQIALPPPELARRVGYCVDFAIDADVTSESAIAEATAMFLAAGMKPTDAHAIILRRNDLRWKARLELIFGIDLPKDRFADA